MVRILNSIKFRITKLKNFIIFDLLKLRFIKFVNHNDIKMKYLITNDITLYRANSFSSKEPMTLKWINSFNKNSCFWDIGANIGLYSIYSKILNPTIKVLSFEPSFKNLNILYENLKLNDLNNEIVIFPLPLSIDCQFNKFILGDDLEGGANSKLKSIKNTILSQEKNSYLASSISIDHLIEKLSFPKPNYLKIDVDGNEKDILLGIKNYYDHIEEILIEIEDYNNNLKSIEVILNYHNFYKIDSETFGDTNKTANFIFKKNR